MCCLILLEEIAHRHPCLVVAVGAAVRNKSDARIRHIVDSLMLLPLIEQHGVLPSSSSSDSSDTQIVGLPQNLSVIDVGSGVWLATELGQNSTRG